MLETLIKEGYLNVEKLLLDKYKKLGLNENEVIVLIHSINLSQLKKNVGVKQLKLKLSFSTKELHEIIDSLVEKNFLGIEIIIKNEKQESMLMVEPSITKIINYLEDEKRNKVLEENENNLKYIIKLCENELERTLSSNELLTISHWFEENIKFDVIKKAILDAIRDNKLIISRIDKIIA